MKLYYQKKNIYESSVKKPYNYEPSTSTYDSSNVTNSYKQFFFKNIKDNMWKHTIDKNADKNEMNRSIKDNYDKDL